MPAPRALTGGRWKTCKKALSTAISRKSAEAVWRPRPGPPFSDVTQVVCLVVPAAACGGDGRILPAADGAVGHDWRGRPAGARGISRDPDRAPLPRDPDQHGF